MRYRALLAGSLLALAPWLVLAGDTEKAPDPGPAPAGEAARDVQDIVFFTATRPVVMRLHVEMDAKPFEERWDAFMSRLFKYLDRDGDNVLSETEADRAPSPQQLQQLLRGQQFFNQQGPAQGGFGKQMDANNDQQVSLDELANFYRRNSAGPAAAVPGFGRTGQDPLTDALFKHLDLNNDGKLSREEVLAAPALLGKFDQDDDELISPQELVANYNPFAGFVQAQPQRGGAPAPALSDDSPFFVVIADGSPKRLTQRLLLAQKVMSRYDKDRNERLSRDEIGFDEATFNRLDANQDGQLDSTEMIRLLNPPVDIEVVLRLGRTEGGAAPVDILSPDGKPAPMAEAVKRTTSGSLMVTLGDAQIDLRGMASQANQLANVRQFFTQQFKTADRNNQGFVTLKELPERQYQFLRNVFTLADRDGDGKLTEKELDAYVDLQSAAAGCTTCFTINEQGRGLFEMLDANRDGRLNRHELRTMWTRMAPVTRDGFISRENLPRQFQVAVSPGQPLNFGRPVNQGVGVPAPVSMDGPLWFRKMDRNGDGRVSEREFLGTREEFQRLDTDGDGEISVEEAKKADQDLRKK